ncbi:MAG TPA: hypothetical protein VF175_04590 [Lacipirellula sp.]
MRLRTCWLSIPLTLLAFGPAQAFGDEHAAHGQSSSETGQPDASDAREEARNNARDEQRHARRQRPSSRESELREARRHYMAGFVRGYNAGFADGLDDYLIIVGRPSDQGSDQASSSASRQRDDERRIRERLRNDARDRARSADSQRRSQQGRQDSTPQQVSGEVVAIKRVTLQNDQQQHLLLLMETDQGVRRIIDAGPASQVRRLSLQPGNLATAEGRFRRTRDGVPVLNARWIESSGQRVAIQGQVTQSSQRSRR